MYNFDIIEKKRAILMNDITLYEKIPELENSFPIKIRKYKGSFMGPHWHEHIELLHIISGTGNFVCGASAQNARSGETVIVNRSELHSYIAPSEVEYICILIHPVFFKNVNFNNAILQNLIPADSTVCEYFRTMFEAYECGDFGSDMQIMSSCYGLMSHLVRNYTKIRLSKSEYESHMLRQKKINIILDFIHENYGSPLSTSVLAKRFFLSEGYLCHLFRDAVGKTVLQYINEFRINKAAVLLESTDESISEIAAKTGFDSIAYFDRIFKKHKGVSPVQYRKAQ